MDGSVHILPVAGTMHSILIEDDILISGVFLQGNSTVLYVIHV